MFFHMYPVAFCVWVTSNEEKENVYSLTAVHPQLVILVSEHKDLYDEQHGCYNSKEITDNKGSSVCVEYIIVLRW